MKDILKAASKTGGAAIISMILSVITTKVLAVMLGATGTGLYAVLTQVYTTALTLAVLGGGSALVQGIASRQDEARTQYLATTFRLIVVGASVACIALVLFAAPITILTTGKSDVTTIKMVRWLALPVGLGAAYVYLSSVMNGFRDIGRLASIRVSGTFVTTLLAYPVALLMRKQHPFALIWLLSVPLLVQVVLNVWSGARAGWFQPFSMRANRAFKSDAARHFFSIAITMLITTQIGNVAFLAINSLVVRHSGLTGAGIFNAAWSLSMQYVMLILTSFGTYFLPVLSGTHEKKARTTLLSNVSRLTTIAMIPLITTMISLKPLIVTTLYSTEYFPALDILRWMLIGDYLKISSWVIAMPVLAYADMKTFLWTEIVWYLGLFVFSFLSINIYGSLQGIGVAFGLLYAIYLLYFVWYVRKRYDFVIPRQTAKIWLIGFGIVVTSSVYNWNHTRVDAFAILWIGAAIVASWFALNKKERVKLGAMLRSRSCARYHFMPLINNFRYRPEIDGLRAIAVLAVVLFHTEIRYFTGGFIGVDVFFVISGFLITSLIWKDLENGRFSIVNFWERRARRILPALVVVTLAVLVAGWFLLSSIDFKNLGQASAAQAIFAANIHYWQDSGYFAATANEKPLLHTWSLAVEEQFYLFAPGLLWLVFLLPKLRTRKGIISLLLLVWILSFALNVYWTAHVPSTAFYLLPARAWELLTGSLFAFIEFPVALSKRQFSREILSFLGLAMIVVPVYVYTPQTPFPGVAALVPCLGSALFIWANGRAVSAASDTIPPSFVGRCLACKPIVFIGLISYSLYLWHWPFLAFSHYTVLLPLSAGYRLTMVGLGFICAILSWKFVETPFRVRRVGASRKSVFTFAGVSLSAIFFLGLICFLQKGFPERFPAQAEKLKAVSTDMAFINDLTPSDVRSGRLVRIGVTDPNVQPTTLIWGDSHAMAALPAIDEFLKEKGRAGRAATHSATPPILYWDFKDAFFPATSPEPQAFNNAVFSNIQSHHYNEVILIASWGLYTKENRNMAEFNEALLKTVQSIVKTGSRPVIFLDAPVPGFNVPKALWLSSLSRANIEPLYKKPSKIETFDYFTPDILAALRAAGAEILNPKDEFLDSSKQHYIIEKEGTVLYRDGDHLSAAGANKMLLPWLREQHSLVK